MHPLRLPPENVTHDVSHCGHGVVAMVSFNMRQLRDYRRLKETLRAGKTIELRDRNEVIANNPKEPGSEP